MIDSKIKNIIFDLGGVIINLSVESTLKKIAELSGFSGDKVLQIYHSSPEFLAYEKGEMTNDQFRESLRALFGVKSDNPEIDLCWNAMLGDIPVERIQLLKEVKTRYRTFLLSNTNAIHLECFTGIVQKAHGLQSLDPLFERAYYSHLMGMRKPDAEIYEYVLKENGLKAVETIFLDDNLANLKGAASVGIQTFHASHPDTIFSLFQ